MKKVLCLLFLILLVLSLAGCGEEINRKELATDIGLQAQKLLLIPFTSTDCNLVYYNIYEDGWSERRVALFFELDGKEYFCSVLLRNVIILYDNLPQVTFYFSDYCTWYNNREYYVLNPRRLVEEGCSVVLHLDKKEGAKLKLKIAQRSKV